MTRKLHKTVFLDAKGHEHSSADRAIKADVEYLIFALGVNHSTKHDTTHRVLENADTLIELLSEYLKVKSDES